MSHKKIVIFIPKTGFRPSYDGKFIESYLAAKDYLLSKYNDIPFEFTISQYISHTFPIDANRNECVSMAIKNDIDLSIFLDTDHIIPADTLYKLIKHDVPIVAGVYFKKGEPHPPVVFTENKELSNDFNVFNSVYYIGDQSIYEHKDLFEADMTGGGCFAVSLDVLKKLKKPYWKYRPVPDTLIPREEKFKFSGNQGLDKELEELYEDWAPTIRFKVENEISDVTEDVWFWKNVRENTDYKLLIDPTIVMPHGPIDVWVDSGLSKVYFDQMKTKRDKEELDKCRVEPLKKVS